MEKCLQQGCKREGKTFPMVVAAGLGQPQELLVTFLVNGI